MTSKLLSKLKLALFVFVQLLPYIYIVNISLTLLHETPFLGLGSVVAQLVKQASLND